MVTGLEALLKTERHQATNQFTTRAPSLADELGLNLAVDWTEIYDARSEASHGGQVALFAPPGRAPGGSPDPAAISQVARAQDLLRAAVRRAIEDGAFREKFATDDAVRIAWPL